MTNEFFYNGRRLREISVWTNLSITFNHWRKLSNSILKKDNLSSETVPKCTLILLDSEVALGIVVLTICPSK